MVSFEATAQSVTGSGTESRSSVENWIFDEKLHAPSKIRRISPYLSQEFLPREVGTWRQREEVLSSHQALSASFHCIKGPVPALTQWPTDEVDIQWSKQGCQVMRYFTRIFVKQHCIKPL